LYIYIIHVLWYHPVYIYIDMYMYTVISACMHKVYAYMHNIYVQYC
jgi:hypothetical protein